MVDKFVILANLRPGKDIPSHGVALATMLDQCGTLITASDVGYSYAQVVLGYQNQRGFSDTIETMTEACSGAKMVVYSSALSTKNIDKPRWVHRRKQEWRRFSLPFMLARKSTHFTLVFDGARGKAFWISLALVLALGAVRPARLRVLTTQTSPVSLLQKLTGLIMAQPLGQDIEEFISRQAGLAPRTLTILWLKGLIANVEGEKTPLLQELEQIIAGATFRFSARNTPLPLDVMHSAHSKLDYANEIPHGVLSRFAQHHRHVLQDRGVIERALLTDDALYLDWYLHGREPRNARPPLPVALESLTTKFAPPAQRKAGNVIPALPVSLAKIAQHKDYGTYDLEDPAQRMAFIGELLSGLAPRCQDISFLPVEIIDYLAAPIAGNAQNISRMELLFALNMHCPLGNIEDMEQPWRAEGIRDWFASDICPNMPGMWVFSTSKRPTKTSEMTFQIAGFTTGQSGLAQNAKMSKRALDSIGLTPELRDRNDASRGAYSQNTSRIPLLRSAILHHVNADAIPRQMLTKTLDDGHNPLHIGYLLWEFETVPCSHMLAGEMLDEIWVPSSFVQRIYENAYGREVINIGKSLSLPDVAPLELSQYGISPDDTVFLCIFDSHSSVERKNPLAVVRAFLEAFPTQKQARLIIKATPASRNLWGDSRHQMRQIRKLAAKDKRIVLIEANILFHSLLRLIKRCDCIVSAHRAEGFGYIPAYGLWYAKPIILTDYSGSTDFCTQQTATPIPYKLVEPSAKDTIAHMENALWADIDINAMAEAMKAIISNPDLAARKAKAGQTLIRQKYTPEALAAQYRKRLRALGVIA